MASVRDISSARNVRRPPPDRGRLLDARQVASEILNDPKKEAWVRRNVPKKITLGRSTVRWYEYDVRDWLLSLRED